MSDSTAIDGETLAQIRASIDRYHHDRYGFAARGQWMDCAPGYSRQAWHDYAGFGWLALPLGADHGGFGDDPRAMAILMAYLGASLALEPVLASTVSCGRLLERCNAAQARQWCADIVAGKLIFAFAHAESTDDGVSGAMQTMSRHERLTGNKALVLHGDVADRLIVSARTEPDGPLRLFALDPSAPGVRVHRYRLIDGRGAASIALHDAPADRLDFDGDVAGIVEAVMDDARLALCAETHGAVRALNELTNAFLKTRKQFGRPIGVNQALQHRMVDLFILQEELQSVIDAAHRAYAGPSAARVRAISGAAAHACTVARQTAHEAVQLHGGIGMSAELPVSHYFKRLMVTVRLLGTRDDHLRRFATAAQHP